MCNVTEPGWVYKMGKQSGGTEENNFANCLWVMWVLLKTIMLEVIATCSIVLAMSMTTILYEILATRDICQG